jgi:hypothetical protein
MVFPIPKSDLLYDLNPVEGAKESVLYILNKKSLNEEHYVLAHELDRKAQLEERVDVTDVSDYLYVRKIATLSKDPTRWLKDTAEDFVVLSYLAKETPKDTVERFRKVFLANHRRVFVIVEKGRVKLVHSQWIIPVFANRRLLLESPERRNFYYNINCTSTVSLHLLHYTSLCEAPSLCKRTLKVFDGVLRPIPYVKNDYKYIQHPEVEARDDKAFMKLFSEAQDKANADQRKPNDRSMDDIVVCRIL